LFATIYTTTKNKTAVISIHNRK